MRITARASRANTPGDCLGIVCDVLFINIVYLRENVCIVPGGRAGLIRIAAVLNNAYLGFFIPDYTAYNVRNFAWKTCEHIKTDSVPRRCCPSSRMLVI